MSSDYTRAIQFQLRQLAKFQTLSAEKPAYVQSTTSTMLALEALRMIETLGYKHQLLATVKEIKHAQARQDSQLPLD